MHATFSTKARERDAKIRRSIQERAEKEKARREIAEMTKQVYEEVRNFFRPSQRGRLIGH